VAAGVAPRLVTALKTHAGVAAMVAQACGTLFRMGLTPPHCAALVAAGAVPLLAAAYYSHPGARSMASSALAKLGYTNTGSKQS
jgi:hypothetical protein